MSTLSPSSAHRRRRHRHARQLKERGFPAREIVPFASERSAGKEIDGVPCRVLADDTIQGFDLALFSAGATTSRAGAEVRRRRRGRRRQLVRVPPRPRDPALVSK